MYSNWPSKWLYNYGIHLGQGWSTKPGTMLQYIKLFVRLYNLNFRKVCYCQLLNTMESTHPSEIITWICNWPLVCTEKKSSNSVGEPEPVEPKLFFFWESRTGAKIICFIKIYWTKVIWEAARKNKNKSLPPLIHTPYVTTVLVSTF